MKPGSASWLSEFKVRVNHLRHGAMLYFFELWMRNSELLREFIRLGLCPRSLGPDCRLTLRYG
jgi:hypothetical protein